MLRSSYRKGYRSYGNAALMVKRILGESGVDGWYLDTIVYKSPLDVFRFVNMESMGKNVFLYTEVV